jgi:hypothetical protein
MEREVEYAKEYVGYIFQVVRSRGEGKDEKV